MDHLTEGQERENANDHKASKGGLGRELGEV